MNKSERERKRKRKGKGKEERDRENHINLRKCVRIERKQKSPRIPYVVVWDSRMELRNFKRFPMISDSSA